MVRPGPETFTQPGDFLSLSSCGTSYFCWIYTPSLRGRGEWGLGWGWQGAQQRSMRADSRPPGTAPLEDIKHSCWLWPNQAIPGNPEAEPPGSLPEACLPQGLAGTVLLLAPTS